MQLGSTMHVAESTGTQSLGSMLPITPSPKRLYLSSGVSHNNTERGVEKAGVHVSMSPAKLGVTMSKAMKEFYG